ncbi:MAG: hypothetical protein K2X11_02715 [Acetobacteraceae bacterium]|nr:hypothetical protein [Acetobacteraceae bacterium]
MSVLVASPFARAVLRHAPGRRVALAWGDAPAASALLLRCLAAGAAAARIVAPVMPPQPDAALRDAAERTGLREEAEALLAAMPCGRPSLILHHADTARPPAWWLHADPASFDIRALLGPVDLLADPAALSDPEPARRLRDLRRTGAARLVLATPVADPGALPGFTADSLWHLPSLDAARRAAIAAWLGREPAAWRWLPGAAALERLLAEEGWRLRALDDAGPDAVLVADAA